MVVVGVQLDAGEGGVTCSPTLSRHRQLSASQLNIHRASKQNTNGRKDAPQSNYNSWALYKHKQPQAHTHINANEACIHTARGPHSLSIDK